MHGFTKAESRLLQSLKTPAKIQDFLDALPINFEENGETCMSPRSVLRERTAHCMEGAMLAACALRMQGCQPLVVDLKVTDDDDDHVIAVFKIQNAWGAISKTNHGTIRYRDPVYRSIRELAMSYFHEYTTPEGKKILRSYSVPVNLARFDADQWMTAEDDLWHIPAWIDDVRHFPILPRSAIYNLRTADAIERKLGAITEWEPPSSATVESTHLA